MDNLKNKTKQQLIDIIEGLEEQIRDLENDVDYWQHEYDELEEINDKLETENDEYGIKDLDDFIFKLKVDNLYTPELEEFIKYYLRFYNLPTNPIIK